MERMETGEILGIVVVIGIFLLIMFLIYFDIANSKEKKRQERRGIIANQKNEIDKTKRCFVDSLTTYFCGTIGNYNHTYAELLKYIDQMIDLNKKLINVSKEDDEEKNISRLCDIASEFKTWAQKVNGFSGIKMLDMSHYGAVNKVYWDSVRALDVSRANQVIGEYERYLNTSDFSGIFEIDVDRILKCIWFYATNKPYSAMDLKKAVSLFNRIYKKLHMDITLAELFAVKQMGGNGVLRDEVRSIIDHRIAGHNLTDDDWTELFPDYSGGIVLPGRKMHLAQMLTILASGLMWMQAYREEEMVLVHMLRSNMQMSAKMQERLHSLSNGGGGAPMGFDVESNHNLLCFDVSALVWKDADYASFFENLKFQDKKLSYSLAVRDEDKDLFLAKGIEIPDMNQMFAKLKSVFNDEYGAPVTAKLLGCIALSDSGEENMTGILVTADACRHMSILVHVACIGKKLDIKFYTLFMPGENNLASQKQQALSIYKKLSPSVTMWESSLKETILMAVQQMLNQTPVSLVGGYGRTTDEGTVEF